MNSLNQIFEVALNSAEATLIQRLNDHDESAMADFYSRYSSALFAVILRIVRDQDAAEDVLQKAMLKIWRSFNTYDSSKERLSVWALNICRNLSIDKLRSMRQESNIVSQREETTIGALLAKHGGSIKTGPFGTALKAKEYSKDGVHLISVGEIGYGTFRISDSTPRVPKEVVERLPEYLLQTNDIVFGRKGGVDRSAIVKPEQTGWFLGSDGIRLRLPDTCDASFIAYQLQSVSSRDWIIQHATGTTMASLNQEVISRIPIVLPPIDEQRRIAHILGALDDKIELNRQLNATLEQLARTLFQSWFVDFDPVRAKASSEPEESICRRLGLTPELLALFPTALEDSAMGEIPEGWEVKPLDGIATFLNGVAAQKYPPQGKDDLPVIKIAQLRKGNTEGADIANASTVPTAYIVENGDVLFSWSGSLEVEIWGGGLGLLNQHLFKVESELFPKWFYFIWTRHHLPSFRLTAADKATTMGHIQRKHLTKAKTLVPTPALLEKMTEIFSPILEQVETFSEESRTLAALRDELLPKLLSGEIRLN